MPAETPTHVGPYQILGPLGRGGVVTAYKAAPPQGGRPVTVRVLSPRLADSPEALERFESAMKAAAALDHPNVVRVVDRGRDGASAYVVNEFVEGGSLADVLRERRLSLQEALGVFKALCRALQHAHSRGVVHREINPRNILASPDLSTVKLANFGLSRLEAASRVSGTLATGELTLGSLLYIAPEQAEDPALVDPRADVYSAGVVLHEMLTGRSPSGKFALPSQLDSELPSEVDVFVLKCVARSPADRYGTASQVLAELERLEEALRLRLLSQIRGITQQTSRLLGEGGGPKPLLLWGGLGLLLVILVVVIFLLALG